MSLGLCRRHGPGDPDGSERLSQRLRRHLLRLRFAMLKGLEYCSPQLHRRHGILQDGHRSQPQGLLDSLGMHPGKHQHHGDHGVLPPHVGQQFQSFGVAGIHAGKNEIDRVSLHQPNRQSVGGGFLDEVIQRLQHRSQES